MTPGIHNISADAYHADPAPIASLSSSIASILLDQSPAHAWLAHPRLNHGFVPDGPDSRFDLGSAAHMMLLERRTDPIVIVEADDWRTKAAREARDAATANGQYAVLARVHADLIEMCATARRYIDQSELMGIFEDGDAEQSILWQEGDTWCRCRPDVLWAERRIVLDYKTTDSAAPNMFARQIGRMSYDLQAEFYLRGANAALEREDAVFVFLCQEITRPYACSLISLSNAYRAVGQAKAARALRLWDTCVAERSWPGYTSKILYAEPKPWDLMEAESAAEDQREEE